MSAAIEDPAINNKIMITGRFSLFSNKLNIHLPAQANFNLNSNKSRSS